MKQFAISAIILASLTTGGSANDGFAVETGGALNYSKSKDVQMVSEDIDIRLSDKSARIQVDFVFKNHGGAKKVVMAFPDQGYDVESPSIKNFKSWVNGAPVKVSFKELKPSNSEDDESGGVWVKSVSFAAGATKKVRVVYDAPHGWTTGQDTYCQYILKTGATWHGKIQRTSIVVDWSELKQLKPPVALEDRTNTSRPAQGWTIAGKRATLTYRNFVPDFDLTLRMLPGFWNFRINGDSIPFSSTNVYPWGEPADLLFPTSELGKLFRAERGEEWSHTSAKTFGGSISFPSDSTVLLGGRRSVSLPRPLVTKWGPDVWNPNYGVKMVRLKDLTTALGGSYAYNPVSGVIDLRIPRTR